jgi:hypothetical protein
MVAESEIVPSSVPSTLALNTTVVEEPAAMVPPAEAPAPVPRRTCTVRDADRYSPWSSRVTSVLVPMLAPPVTWIDPETNVSPLGSTSVRTTPVPVSWPVLETVTVYWRMSPGTTALPGWLLVSVTVVVDAEKSGFTVAIDVMNAPTTYESSLVEAVTVALVSPGFTSEVTFSTSRSMPLMLLALPVVCGRSPGVDTSAPR